MLQNKRKKIKIPIDIFEYYAIILKLPDAATEYGGIAQLGERLNGIQEVSGSIPLISTTKSSENFGFQNFFFVFNKKKFYFIAPQFRGAKLFDPKMTQT